MKRIIIGLLISVAVAGVAFKATLGAWTDNVTITNNRITTGTVDLQVSPDHGANWNSTSTASTMVLSNLAPGDTAVSAYSFSLRNMGTVGPFTLASQIISTNIVPTAGVDKSQLMIQIYEEGGSNVTAELPLTTWETTAWQSMSPPVLDAGAANARHYGIRARLLSTADNTWQGQTVTFTLSVTGTR